MKSKTDWKFLDKMKDVDIDLDDIPEVTEEQKSRATLRIRGKPVSRRKARMNIYPDAEVVAYSKRQPVAGKSDVGQ